MRHCTEDDIPWIMELAMKYYQEIKDYEPTVEWVKHMMKSNQCLFVRNDKAFAIAPFETSPYDGKLRGEIKIFAGNIFYLFRLMKDFKKISEEKGITWFFTSTTSFNIVKLAKFLGAKPMPMSYIMEPINV